MKIRVAILEQDHNYQNRLLVALRERFWNKIEVFPCNTTADVLGVIETHEVKVFAINQAFDMDFSQIPQSCAVVILTETKDDKAGDGQFAVCKYQKVSDICSELVKIGTNHEKWLAKKLEEERKAEEERLERERMAEAERLKREREEEEERQRLEQERLERERREEEERIAAEKARAEEERKRLEEERLAEEERIKERRSNPDIYVFISGGSREGSTMTSISAAANGVNKYANILYLDLKQFSNMSRFFSSANSGAVYAEALAKARLGEIAVEDVEKCIYVDGSTGINYICNSECTYELGMLGCAGFDNLMRIIGEMVKYDIIVVNMDSLMTELTYHVAAMAKKVIFVSSGLPESNSRLERNIASLRKYDEENETVIVNGTSILYNKFVNKSLMSSSPFSTVLKIDGIKVLGEIPVIKEKNEKKMLDSMIKLPVFAQIIE